MNGFQYVQFHGSLEALLQLLREGETQFVARGLHGPGILAIGKFVGQLLPAFLFHSQVHHLLIDGANGLGSAAQEVTLCGTPSLLHLLVQGLFRLPLIKLLPPGSFTASQLVGRHVEWIAHLGQIGVPLQSIEGLLGHEVLLCLALNATDILVQDQRP